MILRRARRLLLIGLGALAAAALPTRLDAQVPVRPDTVSGRRDTAPTRVDSARARQVRAPGGRDTVRIPVPLHADSMIKNDSLARGIVPLPPPVKRDTLKAPLTRAEAPPMLEIGAPRIYDRTALFATGALTLSDLLGRVPGVTEFTTGWLLAPTAIASQGDLRRIRVFLDGLELDPLDRRAQGTSSLDALPIHALEEVRIERGADEVRVYARSWRVDRTTAYTRADVATGDQSTNLYRAFFGRRYDHGEALQVAAEQSNTQPNRQLPSSGSLHLMGRFGMTHGPWSADAFGARTDLDRAPWTGVGSTSENRDTIPGGQMRRTLGYLRLGNGDPDAARWGQVVISSESYRLSPRSTNALTSTTTTSTATLVPDSSSYENQYLLTGGLAAGGARISAAERIRTAGGRTSHVLSGRAAYDRRGLGVSLFGEGQSALAPARVEATVRVVPLDRIALTASGSRTGGGQFSRIFGDFAYTPTLTAAGELLPNGGDSTRVARYQLDSRSNLRAEAGVRLFDVWLSGGLIRRGATTLLPPAEFGTSYGRPGALRVEGQATARTAALRGRLYQAINVDAWAVAWSDSGGPYRPKYQTRSELYIQTNLLDRFPRGNFGLLGSLAHEYRSSTLFPQANGSMARAGGFRTLALKLEIRIQTAVVSYQFRNLLQERYAEVPGFTMPRQTQFYGVRWDFWN